MRKKIAIKVPRVGNSNWRGEIAVTQQQLEQIENGEELEEVLTFSQLMAYASLIKNDIEPSLSAHSSME